MSGDGDPLERLRAVLAGQPLLELAILVGSRATGRAHPGSDWDLAIQWPIAMEFFDRLGHTETLRRALAAALAVEESRIDLIDLPRARLAMRAVVAEEGIPLKGGDTLPWNRFLARTWRELEEYQWERDHAA